VQRRGNALAGGTYPRRSSGSAVKVRAISGHGDQFLLQGHASERVKEQRLFGVSKAEQASLYRLALKSQTFPYRGEPRLSRQ
jgi:hypothetical protein